MSVEGPIHFLEPLAPFDWDTVFPEAREDPVPPNGWRLWLESQDTRHPGVPLEQGDRSRKPARKAFAEGTGPAPGGGEYSMARVVDFIEANFESENVAQEAQTRSILIGRVKAYWWDTPVMTRYDPTDFMAYQWSSV